MLMVHVRADCACNAQPKNPVCAVGLTWMNQCEAECSAKGCITPGVCQYNPDGTFTAASGSAPNGGTALNIHLQHHMHQV